MTEILPLTSAEIPPLTSAPKPEGLMLPHHISSSSLTTWRACKRKFFWSSLMEFSPTGESIHLIAGGAVAAGLEAVRRGVFSEAGQSTRLTHQQLLELALPAFSLAWGEFVAPEGATKSFHNTFSALDDYLQRYNPYDDIIQPFKRPSGAPAIEYKFSIPLDILHPDTNDPICFVGLFDMLGVFQHPSGELPCILDEKTTGSISMRWADQWNLRGQFLGYCWACQQQGLPVNTACVRGIAIQKTQFNCATAIIEYPQFLIDRWYREMYRNVEDIVRAYTALKYTSTSTPTSNPDFDSDLEPLFPLNLGDSCSSYGGCVFATLCEAQDPWRFTSNYTKAFNNPFNLEEH